MTEEFKYDDYRFLFYNVDMLAEQMTYKDPECIRIRNAFSKAHKDLREKEEERLAPIREKFKNQIMQRKEVQQNLAELLLKQLEKP